MRFPCKLIQDLLPLYIDGICSEDSRTAVEAHLEECEKCKKYYEAMHTMEQNVRGDARDMKLENGLKNLKSRINRRTMKITLSAIALVLCMAIGGHLLLEAPLKTLKPGDVSVSAEVYSAGELPAMQVAGENSAVTITKGPEDGSEMMRVEIPAMPNADITMSENVLEELEYITVINWRSDYFLREIISSEEGDGTLYVRKIKTTLLDNKAEEKFTTMQELVTGRISRIVYVDEKGGETVMWEAPAAAVNNESATE